MSSEHIQQRITDARRNIASAFSSSRYDIRYIFQRQDQLFRLYYIDESYRGRDDQPGVEFPSPISS